MTDHLAAAAEAAPASPPLPTSIGLCLSGGGYRATAFHLGALAYLDRVGLGSRLKGLSTVSGGTFTGMRYALALARSQPFAQFFSELYHDLRHVDVPKLSLARLGNKHPKHPVRHHNLIVSAAQVYADTFFTHPDGGPCYFDELLNAGDDFPIDELVFNATEFRHGIAFRFQRSKQGLIGNGKITIPKEEAAKLRIADIVAASSCFPGGFEPMAFPDDFVWPEQTIPEPVKQAVRRRGEGPIALMDGGIYDNQGIDSLLLADQHGATPLDMVIISDVDQASDDLYAYPPHDAPTGMTLGNLHIAAHVLVLLCAVTAVFQVTDMWSELRQGTLSGVDFFRYVIPALLAGAAAYSVNWILLAIKGELNNVPSVGTSSWRDFRKLRIGQLVGMSRLRVTSLLTMSSSIFMARVRSLVYQKIYSDQRYDKRHVISNLISSLTPARKFFFAERADIAPPSPALAKVINVAATMPTTLWWDSDKPYQLPCLVAAGQATLCHNLMKNITRNYGADPTRYQGEVAALWDKLSADWQALGADPYALITPLWQDALAPWPEHIGGDPQPVDDGLPERRPGVDIPLHAT